MRGGGAGEGAGGEADDAFEMTMQEALIVKAHARRDLRLRHAPREQYLRPRDTTMGDVRVRRHADLLAKCPTEAELVETRMRREGFEITARSSAACASSISDVWKNAAWNAGVPSRARSTAASPGTFRLMLPGLLDHRSPPLVHSERPARCIVVP